MRRCAGLLVLLALLLTGCSSFFPKEYLSLTEHEAPFAFRETESVAEETAEQTTTVSNYYDMRSVFLDFVTSGIEHGQFVLENYSGDIEEDLRQVVRYLTAQNPVSAYAVDYINYERTEITGGWLISVDAVYRRSASEIAAIQPVRGNEAALKKMLDALRAQQSSVTMQVSGYADEDFVELLLEYCLYHPDEIVVTPVISVSAYPATGNVRVVETHFVYEYEKDALRSMRTETEAVFSSAYNYIRYGKTDLEKAGLLYTYLTSRFRYTERQEATVYSLLCQGIGSSESAAAVVQFLCEKASIDCYLVRGERQGVPYQWNILRIGDRYYHADYHTDALNRSGLSLKMDADLTDYTWDHSAYPECVPYDLPYTPDTE